jgi:methionyl-tRNA synthetase
MDHLLITPPPTPNGDLHLGHLSGPYLAADVLRRHLRSTGASVTYLSGIDDHQPSTELRALVERRTPEAVADEFGDRIEQAWRAADAAPDLSARPRRNPHHVPLVQHFLTTLWKNDHLIDRAEPLPYCPGCDRFAVDAFVAGRCPHCAAGAGGGSCEACGEPNSCADLIEPHCTLCGAATVERPVRRLWFPLSRHANTLERYWSRLRMPVHAAALCERMAGKGLPDIAITLPVGFGIPVPVPGHAGQRIHVWAEMAPGFLAGAALLAADEGHTGDGPDRWRPVWNDGRTEITQFFGFDNSYYYAMLVPALLAAFEPGIALPGRMIGNEFYRLGDDKFSTSRRHAVWARDFLAAHPVDALRVLLGRDRPAVRQTSFTEDRFRTEQDHITRSWQGWIGSVGHRLRRDHAGRAPQFGLPAREHSDFLAVLGAAVSRANHAYGPDTFDLPTVVTVLDDLVRQAGEFAAAQEHLRDLPSAADRRAAGAALELLAVRTFATLAWPLAPGLATRIATALGVTGDPAQRRRDVLEPIPPGRDVSALSTVRLLEVNR